MGGRSSYACSNWIPSFPAASPRTPPEVTFAAQHGTARLLLAHPPGRRSLAIVQYVARGVDPDATFYQFCESDVGAAEGAVAGGEEDAVAAAWTEGHVSQRQRRVGAHVQRCARFPEHR